MTFIVLYFIVTYTTGMPKLKTSNHVSFAHYVLFLYPGKGVIIVQSSPTLHRGSVPRPSLKSENPRKIYTLPKRIFIIFSGFVYDLNFSFYA